MEYSDRMTWYKIKDWKFKNLNDSKLDISVIESEKIFESEISDIVYDTIPVSVLDEMIDCCYGDVEICGNKYPSSVALKSTSEKDYDEMNNESCDELAKEIMEEMPDKPTTYQAMIDQYEIYWE